MLVLDALHLGIVGEADQHLLELRRNLRALVQQLHHLRLIDLLLLLAARLGGRESILLGVHLLLHQLDVHRGALALVLELDDRIQLRRQLLEHLHLQLEMGRCFRSRCISSEAVSEP